MNMCARGEAIIVSIDLPSRDLPPEACHEYYTMLEGFKRK